MLACLRLLAVGPQSSQHVGTSAPPLPTAQGGWWGGWGVCGCETPSCKVRT